jgi:hypothetical protein
MQSGTSAAQTQRRACVTSARDGEIATSGARRAPSMPWILLSTRCCEVVATLCDDKQTAVDDEGAACSLTERRRADLKVRASVRTDLNGRRDRAEEKTDLVGKRVDVEFNRNGNANTADGRDAGKRPMKHEGGEARDVHIMIWLHAGPGDEWEIRERRRGPEGTERETTQHTRR